MDLELLAAFTIASKNYLAYALALAKSFLAKNENCDFHILIVDRKDKSVAINDNRVFLTWVEDLNIPDFYLYAFKYDILELNTNVKPSFFKRLLKTYRKVLYFDPDIYIYQSVSKLYDSLNTHSVLLTPHITKPINDLMRPNEVDMLKHGVCNLGFIGLRADTNTAALLDWWERRCLDLGYNDIEAGLFVDQKWSILFQYLFDGVHIEKYLGYNVAYWNLQERDISRSGVQWIVNGKDPLVFFHFSGIDIGKVDSISKHLDRFTFEDFPAIKQLFTEYSKEVVTNGHKQYAPIPYGFAAFANGRGISGVARRLFSLCDSGNGDPFSTDTGFYRFCLRNNLTIPIGGGPFSYYSKYSEMIDWRINVINWALKCLMRLFGAERYALFNRYIRYISILRNQKFMVADFLKDNKRQEVSSEQKRH